MSEYKTNGLALLETSMFSEKIKDERKKDRITTLIYLSKAGDKKASERLFHKFASTLEMITKDLCRQWKPDADTEQAYKIARKAFEYSVFNYDNKTLFEPYMKVHVIRALSQFLAR